MARDRKPLFWGTVLLAIGSVWLLSSLNVLGFGAALMSVLVFGGIGLALLSAYSLAPERRQGFLLAAAAFLALGVISFGRWLRILPAFLTPVVLFGSVAAAFAILYVQHGRKRWALVGAWLFGVIGFVSAVHETGDGLALMFLLWGGALPFLWHFARSRREWALVPAGSLLTMGVLVMADGVGMSDDWQSTILFFGLAATFAWVFLLGAPGRVAWAKYAALLCVGLGLMTVLAGPMMSYGLPVALIAFGVYLIANASRPKTRGAAPPL